MINHCRARTLLFITAFLTVSISSSPALSSTAAQTLNVSEATITLKPNAVIAAEGDSLTWGADFSQQPDGTTRDRSPTPYPEALGQILRNVSIENRGFNGDRSIDGLTRWQNTPPAALVLIMYGTNDMGDYGHRAGGTVSIETYRQTMRELITRRQQQGARVVVLLPPPIALPGAESKMQAYRQAAADIAVETKADLLDTQTALQNVPNIWTDGLHLTPEANQAIARGLANHIRVEP